MDFMHVMNSELVMYIDYKHGTLTSISLLHTKCFWVIFATSNEVAKTIFLHA